MSKSTAPKEPSHSFFKDILRSIFGSSFHHLFRNLSEDLKERLDRYAALIEKRFLWLTVCASLIVFCTLLIGAALLFTLIDYFTLSRGIACLCCGLLAGLLLFFFTRLH